MLYLIGLGLNDEKDISLRGLDLVKKAKRVYLENYTSKLNCKKENLEKLYEKKVILADRKFVESEKILEEAKNKDVALLIIGDVFSATTHISLFLEAKKRGIKVKVINNASVLNAIGITGLELYKFGKVTSIPFENKNVKEPYNVFKMNFKNNLHTLFLLDLQNGKYMTVNEALKYLIDNGLSKDLLAVACSKLGSDDFEIKSGKVKDLLNLEFKKFPQSLIIPSKLHFIEEEMLNQWSIK